MEDNIPLFIFFFRNVIYMDKITVDDEIKYNETLLKEFNIELKIMDKNDVEKHKAILRNKHKIMRQRKELLAQKERGDIWVHY